MTKFEWIVQYRESRIQKRKIVCKIDTGSFATILKELYEYIYLPKQQVKIDLVNRYKDKLKLDYLLEYENLVKIWKPDAKVRSNELMKSLVYCENPLLKLVRYDHLLNEQE